MEFTKILEGTLVEQVIGNSSIEISNIEFDSRNVREGDVFFAIKGYQVDGHKFITAAIEKGAKVIVCEEIEEQVEGVTYVKVKDSAIAMGKMAANYYDNPSRDIQLIGVTGTNGKTTTTTLLYHLFTKLGYKCALLSTIENRIGENILKSTHTTADQITINKLLRHAVEEGCDYAFMEVSSHGIHQNRLAGLEYKVAAFTNITHDHLDYHETFANYIAAKKKFFDDLPSTAIAVTNLDDKNGEVMLQNTKAKKVGISLETMTDYKGKIIETRLDGMLLDFNGNEFWSSLSGKFNAYNTLLAYAIAVELGIDSLEVLTKLSELERVKGRFETFVSEDNKYVVVDYAHTPDALENILNAIEQVRTKNEQLITVFGCGGDRDTTKRPEMGDISTKLSDLTVITSDNPRTENPEQIIKDIEAGVQPQFSSKYLVISDRYQAIKTALTMAKEKDIVLIAGKGHEDYQDIQGVKYPFDDMKTAQEILTNQLED